MVTPIFNKTTLRTAGDNLRTRASGGIRYQTYTEGYFMQPSPLSKDYVAPDKTNPLLKLLKKMIKGINNIFDSVSPKEPKHFDIETKEVRGTTIQI